MHAHPQQEASLWANEGCCQNRELMKGASDLASGKSPQKASLHVFSTWTGCNMTIQLNYISSCPLMNTSCSEAALAKNATHHRQWIGCKYPALRRESRCVKVDFRKALGRSIHDPMEGTTVCVQSRPITHRDSVFRDPRKHRVSGGR